MTLGPDLFGGEIDYVIDTSALIDLRLRYPPDVAPGAWDLFEVLISEERLASVDEVLQELSVKDDEVYKWAKGHADIFFPMAVDIQRAGKAILRSHTGIIDVKDRKSGADPFVVGTAKLYDATVVTHERYSRNHERPKIPDVCDDLGIPWIDLVKMFRREGLVLVQEGDSRGRSERSGGLEDGHL